MAAHATRRQQGSGLEGVFARSWSSYATGHADSPEYPATMTPTDRFEAWKASGCRPLIDLDDLDAALVSAYLDNTHTREEPTP